MLIFIRVINEFNSFKLFFLVSKLTLILSFMGLKDKHKIVCLFVCILAFLAIVVKILT